jgi:pimeloyl-ACP methyl ester carboxylesterase
MKKQTLPIKAYEWDITLHRFSTVPGGEVVVLFHGYFEDGRIFYSNNGKGLAPFLASNGFDVFVVDFPGKSESKHTISQGLDYSQHDIITKMIPTILETIRTLSGKTYLHIGAHSWGGVVVMAYMARFKDAHLASFFSFGAKRRIGRINVRRLIYIEFGWNVMGNYLCNKHGYLPFKKMRMGNEDEAKSYFKQTSKWIYSRNWIDPYDQFDYTDGFKNYEAPRSLFITGKGDKILGHPKDVAALKDELHSSISQFEVIGKHTGYKHNYDHINLLTHKDAPSDHFLLIVNFLKKRS